MKPGSLSARLSRMKQSGVNPGVGAERRIPDDGNLLSELPGWRRIGNYTFFRETTYESVLPERIDSLCLSHENFDTRRFLFFDTETTGLSSGAGTIAFLVGVGRSEGERFVVRQYFLSDFPGEFEYLSIVAGEFPSGAYLASYNGGSFDLPLLRTRFTMNGMRFGTYDHIDLLHHARRMWQSRIGACSLSDIEREVLGTPRIDDIPGIEIPDRYFGFLRHRHPSVLEAVFEHHCRDIVTLHHLLDTCEREIVNGDPRSIDVHRTGKWVYRRNPELGRSLIETGYLHGDASAGLTLAVMHRRNRDWGEAVGIWRELWHAKRRTEAGVELAKYLEHRERNYHEALEIIEAILEHAPRGRHAKSSQLSIPSLSKRRERLRERIAAMQTDR